ncbi:MAG TPA: phytanoyl-CoA dioxygenase family protein [Blastocatellia bacterium]
MSRILSNEILERYDRDGIAFPIRVFSDQEVGFFRDGLDSIVRIAGPMKRLDGLHMFFDWASALVRHGALLDVIQDLLGSDILVLGTLVFYKPPRDNSYASWHQDSVYSGMHLTPSTSAWIALTPSNPSNGCMRVIPGSHKLGQLAHINSQDRSNLLRRGEQLASVDDSQAVDVILQPGEMSLHQSTIVHGSNPNTSDGPRIGFIVRFVTNRIEDRDKVMLRVRGKADCGHLTLAEPLPRADHQSAVAAWLAFANSRQQPPR